MTSASAQWRQTRQKAPTRVTSAGKATSPRNIRAGAHHHALRAFWLSWFLPTPRPTLLPARMRASPQSSFPASLCSWRKAARLSDFPFFRPTRQQGFARGVAFGGSRHAFRCAAPRQTPRERPGHLTHNPPDSPTTAEWAPVAAVVHWVESSLPSPVHLHRLFYITPSSPDAARPSEPPADVHAILKIG